jgi:hypothetical protein
MNRRIRNRTYGGVGGREPRGSLLPDPPLITLLRFANCRGSSEATKLNTLIDDRGLVVVARLDPNRPIRC